MISLENFRKLVELMEESEKELQKYEDLNILLGEERVIESHWEIRDLLVYSLLNEAQADFFNWWFYENYMGEGWFEKPMKYTVNNRDLYTGKDVDKIWKELNNLQFANQE